MPKRLPLNKIYFTPHIDCGSGLTLLRIYPISWPFGIIRYAVYGVEQRSGVSVDFRNLNKNQAPYDKRNLYAVHYLIILKHKRILRAALPKLTKILQNMVL